MAKASESGKLKSKQQPRKTYGYINKAINPSTQGNVNPVD